MNILLVSQCSKRALTETRRILDQFAERRGDLDLALGLAAQRDLARRAAILGLAVRLAQVRQELVLRILADAVLGTERLDPGFLEL